MAGLETRLIMTFSFDPVALVGVFDVKTAAVKTKGDAAQALQGRGHLDARTHVVLALPQGIDGAAGQSATQRGRRIGHAAANPEEKVALVVAADDQGVGEDIAPGHRALPGGVPEDEQAVAGEFDEKRQGTPEDDAAFVILAFHFHLELQHEPGEEFPDEKGNGLIGFHVFAKIREAFQREDGGDHFHHRGRLGQISQTQERGVEGVEFGPGQDSPALAFHNGLLEIGLTGLKGQHGNWC